MPSIEELPELLSKASMNLMTEVTKDKSEIDRRKHYENIYGQNFFNIQGNTISEKILRYWCNKIIKYPHIYRADIRQLKISRQRIDDVVSEYNNMEIYETKLKHRDGFILKD